MCGNAADRPEMKLKSPAKINLCLHVVGRRSDGYHLLDTLMCPVGIYDTIRLTFNRADISVRCSNPAIPEDETNLAYQAARLFRDAHAEAKGVAISIEKKIPVGAGLGGGSSNAGSVLLGLNQFYGYPFRPDQLMRMGVKIGADVPFFILQRPALASGIGERLLVFNGLKRLPVVIVYPGIPLSTAAVYKKLKYGLTKNKKKNSYFTFKAGEFQIPRDLVNDLEAPARVLCPEISKINKALSQVGADGILVSGSGSSVFGLFAERSRAGAAMKVLAAVQHWQVFVTRLLV